MAVSQLIKPWEVGALSLVHPTPFPRSDREPRFAAKSGAAPGSVPCTGPIVAAWHTCKVVAGMMLYNHLILGVTACFVWAAASRVNWPCVSPAARSLFDGI